MSSKQRILPDSAFVGRETVRRRPASQAASRTRIPLPGGRASKDHVRAGHGAWRMAVLTLTLMFSGAFLGSIAWDAVPPSVSKASPSAIPVASSDTFVF